MATLRREQMRVLAPPSLDLFVSRGTFIVGEHYQDQFVAMGEVALRQAVLHAIAAGLGWLLPERGIGRCELFASPSHREHSSYLLKVTAGADHEDGLEVKWMYRNVLSQVLSELS